ncbi:uncharacterized protein LOC114763028 isoform X2 [Neltuma alba]|uniref:uncharacterized protein LOC114762575 isoform X2 n=1 Tax=Neltuma alba TaxID=207710 RepID=UPI0010A55F25|nr:uncharacterized protein LOC114762575 isoform X2 [Prosopis alba]XP_028808458.1 uncharacterized protein LOC114763028 isoform X2 [Prosopis alba]
MDPADYPFPSFPLDTGRMDSAWVPWIVCGATLSYRPSFKISCKRSKATQEDGLPQGFSVLPGDSPWEGGILWSTFAFYVFSVHVPLSFGGLPAIAWIMGKNRLSPQTEILGILFIQILELNGALFLLKYMAKPQYKLPNFFKSSGLVDRNWVLASAVGFGVLVLLLYLLSLIESKLFGPTPVSSPVLKEILLSSDVSRVASVMFYCIVCPLLEEIVYRGFMLTSLSPTMGWLKAVALSSAIFGAIHFSVGSFLHLFTVGCVLGCSYCWTGNLKSPFLIHSLYNALTLMISYLY